MTFAREVNFTENNEERIVNAAMSHCQQCLKLNTAAASRQSTISGRGGTAVLRSLAETAAASWRLLSLVVLKIDVFHWVIQGR